MGHSHGGAKVGHRVAAIVSNAVVYTHQKLLDTKHRLAMMVFDHISDIISEEVQETLGPIFLKMNDELDDNNISKNLVNFMATKHGQLKAAAGIQALSGGLLSSLAEILNNELAPAVQDAIASNPHGLPDPGTIAQAAAAGLITTANAHVNIAQNGLVKYWADILIALNTQYPDSGTMLDMMRRGLITPDLFIAWTIRQGIPGEIADLMAQLVDVPLSPADAALAVLRGNMTAEQGQQTAAKWGVSQETFTTLIDNTGEPLGLMQLLEAERRGFIDEPTLVRGILQSRVRDEWIPTAVKLSYSPMSVADAVNAVVQNNLTMDQGSQIAAWNGLETGAFPVLVATAGSPLSRTEMEDLYNRGLVTEAQVLQSLRESRLKDKYGPYAFELHQRLIPVSALSDAVVYGSISVADAVSKAMAWGHSETDATILVTTAIHRKLQSYRQTVVSAAEQQYAEGAITQTEFASIAEQMNLTADEVGAIIQAADIKEETKFKNAAISVVRNKYIARHIVKADAQSDMDALGIMSTESAKLFELWDIERQATVRVLTEAQIVKAVNNQLITADDGLSRLITLGYSSDDAQLLLNGA